MTLERSLPIAAVRVSREPSLIETARALLGMAGAALLAVQLGLPPVAVAQDDVQREIQRQALERDAQARREQDDNLRRQELGRSDLNRQLQNEDVKRRQLDQEILNRQILEQQLQEERNSQPGSSPIYVPPDFWLRFLQGLTPGVPKGAWPAAPIVRRPPLGGNPSRATAGVSGKASSSKAAQKPTAANRRKGTRQPVPRAKGKVATQARPKTPVGPDTLPRR